MHPIDLFLSPSRFILGRLTLFVGVHLLCNSGQADESFVATHCFACHRGDSSEGGLDFAKLSDDLTDPWMFNRWERIFDRVAANEMPPRDEAQPRPEDKQRYLGELDRILTNAHAKQRETVLRRLNRREYENTINDLFGTNLALVELLPEDGRSHEFDNVGEALGISSVQLQKYLECIRPAIEEAKAALAKPIEPKTKRVGYAETQGSDQWLGKIWLKLEDGAVVWFREFGYPSGLLRESSVQTEGWYKVQVTGYAYQSDKPITFALEAASFNRGQPKIALGYFEFRPGEAQTIEVRAHLPSRYMIEITPQGITDRDQAIKKNGVHAYRGPGLAIRQVEIEGPLPDERRQRGADLLFAGLKRNENRKSEPKFKTKNALLEPVVVSSAPNRDATQVLLRVTSQAFRRPSTQKVIEPYLALFNEELKSGSSFEEALLSSVSAVFSSSRFLYLTEASLPGNSAHDAVSPSFLDDFDIASRLSYFLNRSTPDDKLLDAARQGGLSRSNEALVAEARRLMQSRHFERFIVDFTDAWLNLREIDFTNPDAKLYPEFDRYLRWSMLEETRRYFRELIEHDLGVAHFVKSDFAMLNGRLAEHYGIAGVEGSQVQRFALPPDSVRGAFLGQASVHKVSANGTNTSPVVRGVWVMERILGEPPQPPPPGVPGIEPDIRGASTLRELLDSHRNLDSCRSCHRKIDPPGFALESFDPIGGWRENFRSLGEGKKVNAEIRGQKVRYFQGPPVDASGNLSDGRSFAGFSEFQDLLAADEDKLAKAFVTKLLTFATGREMGFSDRREIDRIVEAAVGKKYGLRTLIELVITSPTFRQR